MKPDDDYKTRFLECDDKFNRIFTLTGAASKIINAELTILKVNNAVTELLGYSGQEIEGTKILDYACEQYIEHWHHLQDALWSRKLPFFKLEACLRKKDGSLVWVKVTTVLFNENGQTYGFTVLDDFTYRKNFDESEKQLKQSLEHATKVQENLRQSEQHLSRTLETMAEGVVIIDTSGKPNYVNPMAQKILGLSKDVILDGIDNDQKWKNFNLDGSLVKKKDNPIWNVMDTGVPVYDAEFAIQPQEGERIYISVNAAPIFNEQKVIEGAVCTFMDVTARRKLTQLKDEFISVASHELRTPVTSLKASLQLLHRMKDNPSVIVAPKLIDQANKSLNKVSSLISDLLNASKLNEGQLFLNKKWFSILNLIDDCCYEVRIAGEYAIVPEGDLEIQIFADADRIDQVLTNLINNALKYAPASKVIRVNIKKQEDSIKISVIDKGPGIKPEKLPHLFERYYRVDTGNHQFSGLGLGLYISAEIVKKHGGQIGVESEPGNGATFWFTIPV